jgi:hypothetical protein
MEFDEQVELTARIVRTITNPDLNIDEKLGVATKWLGAARITAEKWGISVSAVLDIDDKLREGDMFPPDEMSHEEEIFWDYVNECNQFEHIEGE